MKGMFGEFFEAFDDVFFNGERRTKAICIASVILIAAMIFAPFTFWIDSGTGEQIGYIAEVENNGWLWKPTEITLIGSEATFSESQTSWEYATASPEVTDMARHYLKTHEKVIVYYETVNFKWDWEYSHLTKITRIESIGAKNNGAE